MDIAIIGTGYVGLVSGACLAELGNKVYCVDIDHEKIERLRQGEIPIYEPKLDKLVARNQAAGRLHFTTSIPEVMPQVEVIFIAVGTPPSSSGDADLSYVQQVATTIGQNLTRYMLVVNKSTVPVGTAEEVRSIIRRELDARGENIEFDVASNPEFLKEGAAIDDFMRPDRVIVGVDSERAKAQMADIYKPMMLSNFRVIFMDIRSAEMTKYAANAMLATRISFMNDIANLCELVGADVGQVRQGMGTDSRIGLKFLYPGCGYGGSCFPKDVQALIRTAQQNNYHMRLLEAVEAVNQNQKRILFRKFQDYFKGNIQGRHAAVWGLAFKPGTDDMREASSIVLIEQLLNAGCTVTAYDPVAMKEAQKIFGSRIAYAKSLMETVQDADAIFHVTEWNEFRMPDWKSIRSAMRTPLIIDGRNVFDEELLAGFDYLRIG